MRIPSLVLACVLPLAVVACAVTQETGTPTPHSTPDPAIDGKGAFATGKYRNLFAELGHSQEEIDAKLNKAFQQLFHGDRNTQAIYYEAGQNADGPLGYITDVANRDVRTEGLSYGMMIAVQMDKKAEFDAIWNWANTYLYVKNPSSPNVGYFAWTANTNGTLRGNPGPAPDGEEYFTMALYFAAHRWPGGTGLYDYKARADKLLDDMLHHTSASNQAAAGRGGRGGGAGGAANNMFEPNSKMVRFVPGATYTDPSYHLPHYYELWARWGPEKDREFWLAAATASRDLFAKVAHPTTGLCPDQCSFAGVPSRGNQGAFQADAWRCQSNIAVDWSWFAKDPREQDLSNKVQATFAARGMDSYPEKMSLDGRNIISNRHVIGLVATNATASLAATEPLAKDFVEALWNAPIPDGQDRYYSGCLYLMNFLHCSGQFRIW